MSLSEKQSQVASVSTAEAFYVIFRALPKEDRLIVARYILEDDDIRHCGDMSEIPNQDTLKAFAEDKSAMPLFHSIEELRKDLLA
ncbi:MAG: hypothetical protein V2I97_10285 [Desulfococcaceae bacterium]|jgi:hypothetical protein|nr:hypothetical protein [Desulfococcaceae bacterium]